MLVTGPTGSGKTTTLYAAMNEVNSPEKTLITVEDPVEYELDGVKQVQVHPKGGLTFASGLRSLVRADPDVIMVGEVRDAETAALAIESALTGHLVLTTLHTNDAPLAAARLVDMGIEPFLVAAGIECVVAQRLVRRLCDCKQPVKLSKPVLVRNGFAVERGFGGFEPGGCVRCAQTGYRGRIGLYEVMLMTRPSAPADPREARSRRAARRRPSRGHAHAARGRAREDQARDHLGRPRSCASPGSPRRPLRGAPSACAAPSSRSSASGSSSIPSASSMSRSASQTFFGRSGPCR